MKKRRKILSAAIGVCMLAQVTAFAQDGTRSCTFNLTSTKSGAGYLTVSSSQFVARTTIPSGMGQAWVQLEYEYKDNNGKKVENKVAKQATQTVEIRIGASGTSARKGHSTHQAINYSGSGTCSLWQ